MCADRPALGALRRRVREALTAGLLPLARHGAVVRRGTGRLCFVCEDVLMPADLEREVRLTEERRVVVHEPCYQVWRVETMARVATRAGRESLP